MNNYLFENVKQGLDQDWIVKEFFNSLYAQDIFVLALPFLIDKSGYSINYEYCIYPNLKDPDPEFHFSGVKVGIMDNELLLTEPAFFSYLRQACELYCLQHPEQKLKIDEMLS